MSGLPVHTLVRLLALVLLVTSCAQLASGPGRPSPAAIVDPPRRPGKELVVIAMPDLESFRTVRRALVDELGNGFDVSTQIIDEHTTPAEFADQLSRSKAACVVLMNNPTVNLYRAYQSGLARGATPVPAVVVMSSFLEELKSKLSNATGVAFEVPGVSALVSLRSVVAQPVRRVGVIHRPAFRPFLARQIQLADKEQITLVPAAVPADPSIDDVRAALAELRRANIDALWVLNDNRIIESAEYREAIAALGTPVVVGVPALVASDAEFGTLAVLPDLVGLGVQTANLVVDVSEDDWNVRSRPVELPLSTLTFANMSRLRRHFNLRPDALHRIDRQID